MSTRQYLLRGSLVYKWPLIAHAILNISISVAFPTLVALTQRAVFDSLTGHATGGFGVWELIGILVALGVVATLQHAGSVVTYYYGAFNVRALFQRNIFAYMMNLPATVRSRTRAERLSIAFATTFSRHTTILRTSQTSWPTVCWQLSVS